MKTKLLLAMFVVVAIAAQQAAMAFLGPSAGSGLSKEAVQGADTVVAGTVTARATIGSGVTTNSGGSVLSGEWLAATVSVDHVLKGGPEGQIRVLFFRPDNGMMAAAYDSLEMGSRYLLCLRLKAEQKDTYVLGPQSLAEIETPPRAPAGISQAHTLSEHMECELIPMIESSDAQQRTRAIVSVMAVPTRSSILLHAVEQATHDLDTSVSETAKNIMDSIASEPKTSP